MESKNVINSEVCILGAGPAGLATSMELVRNGAKNIIIIEKNSIVGGLSRTEDKGSARFDVGPHRFFTKNPEINNLWHETLKEDFIPVNRLTRIYYDNKFFKYPIEPLDVFLKFGVRKTLLALQSFIIEKIKIKKDSKETFEDWIVNKFGWKLYETFFKTYTEKVWGIPCNQISAEWAAQRIKGLDFLQLIKNSLQVKNRDRKIKTLVDQFDYPRLGAGQMYEAWANEVDSNGVKIILNTKVVKVILENKNIKYIVVEDYNKTEKKIHANVYFSSIPITFFFSVIEPRFSDKVISAASKLYYRNHITVDLIVDKENVFPDQWIYIHSPNVVMARIANYKNFSAVMVNSPKKSPLSIEYFVFQNDALWNMNDSEIVQFAIGELEDINLIDKKMVEQAWVVRESESYPTYYLGFKEPFNVLKSAITEIENLIPIGRGGMYKYNNQDHSILSGLLAARNYLSGNRKKYDLWEINIDAEYHESGKRII